MSKLRSGNGCALVLADLSSAKSFSKALAKAWRQMLGDAKAVLKRNWCFFLEGPLGSGKSFLVREFLKACGWKAAVNSPSFSLREDYQLTSGHVAHLDLYRLKTPYELVDLGVEELFSAPITSFIEWPTTLAKWLPEPDITLHLNYISSSPGRSLNVVNHTLEGQELIKLCLENFAAR